jgi:copper(I)-binding protein
MATAARADVTVVEPWVRGMVPGQSVTGMFMTIRSTSATRLIAVASPVADHVEIHKMTMDKDVMVMQPVSALAVPANGQVELKPGSYHVMLLGAKQPLVKGQKIPVTLTFQDSD